MEKAYIVKGCLDLIKAIGMIETIFERSLLVKTSLLLVSVVLITFLGVATLFDAEAFTELHFYMALFSYGCHGLIGKCCH